MFTDCKISPVFKPCNLMQMCKKVKLQLYFNPHSSLFSWKFPLGELELSPSQTSFCSTGFTAKTAFWEAGFMVAKTVPCLKKFLLWNLSSHFLNEKRLFSQWGNSVVPKYSEIEHKERRPRIPQVPSKTQEGLGCLVTTYPDATRANRGFPMINKHPK